MIAHELAHVVQQSGTPGGARVQRKPRTTTTPVDPQPRGGPGHTERIEDAYPIGSLGETRWRDLLASAEKAADDGRAAEAIRMYLILYQDAAKIAQADYIVRTSSASIAVATGPKNNPKGVKPGLNFVLQKRSDWGTNATTAFVDPTGKFGVRLNPRGQLQPEVAIVLTRSAFKPNKEETLAILRHELTHADIDNEDASAALAADPKVKAPPDVTSEAKSEVLAYLEGFMTMFHLTDPPPNDVNHPSFIELLGAIEARPGFYPWASVGETVRKEAVGRLQEYYCHALDEPHRNSFDGWVMGQAESARRNRINDTDQQRNDFFGRLEQFRLRRCKPLIPMAR